MATAKRTFVAAEKRKNDDDDEPAVKNDGVLAAELHHLSIKRPCCTLAQRVRQLALHSGKYQYDPQNSALRLSLASFHRDIVTRFPDEKFPLADVAACLGNLRLEIEENTIRGLCENVVEKKLPDPQKRLHLLQELQVRKTESTQLLEMVRTHPLREHLADSQACGHRALLTSIRSLKVQVLELGAVLSELEQSLRLQNVQVPSYIA